MQQTIFGFLLGLMRRFTPNALATHERQIAHTAVCNKEQQAREDRRRYNEIKYADLIGKRVIVFGNNDADMVVGYLESLDDMDGKDQALPVIYNVLTKQHVLSFGVVVPYNQERLTMMSLMNPSLRWDFVNCISGHYRFETYKCAPRNEEQPNTSYVEMMKKLERCGFTTAETFDEYLHPEPKLFETVASATNS